MVLTLVAGPDTGLARRAYHQALDRLTIGDLSGAYHLLRAARAAEPAFLEPSFVELRLRLETGAGPLELRTGDDPVLRCLAIPFRLREPLNADPAAALQAIEQLRSMLDDRRARRCASAMIFWLGNGFGGRGIAPEVWRQDQRRGLALAGGIRDIAMVGAANALTGGDPARAITIYQGALKGEDHVRDRIALINAMAGAHLAAGDTTGARRSMQRAVMEARTDGRPGVIALLAKGLPITGGLHPDVPTGEKALEWVAEMERASGDRREEAETWRLLALHRIDAGRPRDAVEPARRAVQLMEQHGPPIVLLKSRTALGRALAKGGRTPEALEVLRRAIAGAPSSGARYELAEAWHNLAHAYEGAGRWAEAASAADRFVAISAPMRWDGLRVISLRDAGTIKRAAGWHAAAARDFARMVGVIEDQDQNHVWAGEFLEREGQLDAALAHYRRGAELNEGDPQNAAGITRVFLAIGRLDSAATWARRHDADSARWRPLEGPLLPQVLRLEGRADEAARLLRGWTLRRIEAGNVAGASRAALTEGEMLMAAGSHLDALRAASLAESLATVLHLAPERSGALLLRARALSAAGRRHEALRAAQVVLEDPAASPMTRIVAGTLEGDLFRSSGATEQALSAYLRAGRIVEQIAGQLDSDLDRAGYRHRELAPFDAAIDLLLQQEAPAALILRWSARRKAAALRIEGDPTADQLSLPALQASLGGDRVVADYLVTGTRIGVVVVTRSSARVLTLPLAPDSLLHLINRIRAPFTATVAGRLDVARTRLDTAATRAVANALLLPLREELARVDHLVVVPDGGLGLLPFDVLPGIDGERFLLQRIAVSYSPNTRFIRPAVAHQRGPVLVVAGSAPATAPEAAGIVAAWPAGNVRILTGSDATESATLPRTPPGILHVATHAVADGRDPWATHLRLASDAKDDGFLHLTEIAAGNGAPLVILSACSAVPGPVLGAEGPIGLARAFLVAGSRSVIGTAWPVGPTAATYAGHLHRYLALGHSPVRATRLAKLELLADPATASPFHWGAWMLVGG